MIPQLRYQKVETTDEESLAQVFLAHMTTVFFFQIAPKHTVRSHFLPQVLLVCRTNKTTLVLLTSRHTLFI